MASNTTKPRVLIYKLNIFFTSMNFNVTQARIQEFSSGGGPTFRKFWQAKKKKKKRGGDRGLWLLSFLQKNGLNQFSRQLFAYKFFFFFLGGGLGHGKSLSTKIHRWHGRFDIVYVFGMGGLGVLLQKIFSLNGVKSCNSRQG